MSKARNGSFKCKYPKTSIVQRRVPLNYHTINATTLWTVPAVSSVKKHSKLGILPNSYTKGKKIFYQNLLIPDLQRTIRENKMNWVANMLN